MAWPPSSAEFYLHDNAGRSAFQGDIYANVPFTKAGRGDQLEVGDPHWSAKRKHVAPILYPCAMYGSDGFTLVRAQPVAAVYEASGIAIPEDWNGALDLCPLPDLLGDGQMWVVDFRLITTIDRAYLAPAKRVRSLSELGWAVFRQRLLTASTRASAPLEDVLFVGQAAWEETSMETVWLNAGRDAPTFQAWLDAPDELLAYETPRRSLEAREIDSAWDALRRALE